MANRKDLPPSDEVITNEEKLFRIGLAKLNTLLARPNSEHATDLANFLFITQTRPDVFFNILINMWNILNTSQLTDKAEKFITTRNSTEKGWLKTFSKSNPLIVIFHGLVFRNPKNESQEESAGILYWSQNPNSDMREKSVARLITKGKLKFRYIN